LQQLAALLFMTTLLLTSRFARDDQLLWQAAVRRSWNCERLRGTRVPEIDDAEIVVYAEAFYKPLIERSLHLRLLDLPEKWLVVLPDSYRLWEIREATLREAATLRQAAFIKPPNDKSFKAKVYASGTELPAEYDQEMKVLVAEPVQWVDEFRCFVLDGKVRTISPYLRSGELAANDEFRATSEELAEAAAFAELVAASPDVEIPRAVALDVGWIHDRGWAVVEANGAWGSGIYGCDPEAVLDVIQHAVVRGECHLTRTVGT
jgi:hypothetical protein